MSEPVEKPKIFTEDLFAKTINEINPPEHGGNITVAANEDGGQVTVAITPVKWWSVGGWIKSTWNGTMEYAGFTQFKWK